MIPIPATQRLLLEQNSGNAALYFARMTPYDEGPGGKPKKDAIAILGEKINKRLTNQKNVLEGIHKRQSGILKTTALQGGMVWEFIATLQSPYVSGLGSGHPTETGFILDRNTGLPCISASAIKGVLRLACALHIEKTEPDCVQKQRDKNGQWTGQWEIPDTHPLFRRYFGDTDSGKKDSVRGQLAFLDAFPAALPAGGPLKTDIMNPHFGKYYAGEQGPLETESPVPVKFLAVKGGAAFVFRCLALPLPERDPNAAAADVFRPFDGEDDAILQALFEIVCDKLGFGAKTAVGYGRLTATAMKTTADFTAWGPWLRKLEHTQDWATLDSLQNEQEVAGWKNKPGITGALQAARKRLCKNWLQTLDAIDDWGAVCQKILNSKEAEDWRQEDGVAEAVRAVFERVRNTFRNKWTDERDDRCREWLEPAGIPWPSLLTPDKVEPETPQSELEKRIQAFKDYGAYSNAKLDIATLSLAEAQTLQEQLKKWGCNDKKAKGDKPKHWQALQKRLKDLRSHGT